MKKFIENLKSYLQNVLNTSVNVHPWKDTSSFPIFLIDSYDFYNLSIFDLSCLFSRKEEIVGGLFQINKLFGMKPSLSCVAL